MPSNGEFVRLGVRMFIVWIAARQFVGDLVDWVKKFEYGPFIRAKCAYQTDELAKKNDLSIKVTTRGVWRLT